MIRIMDRISADRPWVRALVAWEQVGEEIFYAGESLDREFIASVREKYGLSGARRLRRNIRRQLEAEVAARMQSVPNASCRIEWPTHRARTFEEVERLILTEPSDG